MKELKQYIIVDDDRTNNLICEYAVKAYDPAAGVLTFNTPEHALSTLMEKVSNGVENTSTILFIDVNMPTMSGWEFLKELEKMSAEVLKSFTIFILSSSIEDFAYERKNYPYVQDFLSKPLSKARLQELGL